MSGSRASLLAGRNRRPLSPEEIRRAVNTFLGLDTSVNTRYEPESITKFRVAVDASGEYGEIIIGPDIYPGESVVDPNAALSLDAAAAHELTHYYRWRDKRALSIEALEHIDEALTSLEAASRYDRQLKENDIRNLIADAITRLQLFVSESDK